MKTPIRLVVLLIASLGLSHGALASTTTYTFSAAIAFEIRGNQLATPQQSLFTQGSVIAGSFDYSSIAQGFPNEGGGVVYGNVSNLLGSVEGNVFSDPSGGILVSNNGLDLDPNDPNSPLVDLLAIGAEGGPVADLNGFSLANGPDLFTLVNVRLFWFDSAFDFLDDNSLPAQLAPSTEVARLALDFADLSGSGMTHTVFADPLVLTAAPVPVPAAVWLMLSALGLLGVKRKQHSL